MHPIFDETFRDKNVGMSEREKKSKKLVLKKSQRAGKQPNNNENDGLNFNSLSVFEILNVIT